MVIIMVIFMVIIMVISNNHLLDLSGQLGGQCYQLTEDLSDWTVHSQLPRLSLSLYLSSYFYLYLYLSLYLHSQLLSAFDTHTRALAAVLPVGAFLVPCLSCLMKK